MARKRRTWHAKGYYHVIMRGNNRQNIFIDPFDMQEYHRILTYIYVKHPFHVYAYCIMTNHVHLLLQSPEVSLSKLMALLNKRYSDYYRKRHRFTGQIYQGRYYSSEIVDPKGILDVSAYIHLNPLETKVPMVQHLENYPYSSYPYYFHNQTSSYSFLQLNTLPAFMPAGKRTKTAYAKWCLTLKQLRHYSDKNTGESNDC